METLMCNVEDCHKPATKFCFFCKRFLCRTHKIEDVKAQHANSNREHYYIEAFQYWSNKEKFTSIYCNDHPCEMLTRRCINCFQFACSSCLPQWCPKAGGRYHDYSKMMDIVIGYEEKLSEFQRQLQQRQEVFLIHLKEAYQKQQELKLKLNEMLHDIDTAVELQIATVTEEGKKLKEEIVHEMSQITSQINENIKNIEEKESMGRRLLQDIHDTLHIAGGITSPHNYSQLKEETAALVKWTPHPVSISIELIQGTESKSLGLTLAKAVGSPKYVPEASPNDTYDDAPPQQESKIEKMHVKSGKSKELDYWGLSFLSEDKLVACGVDWLSHFTETREGETLSTQYCDSPVLQVLPWGNQVLVLSYDCNFKVRFLDTNTTLYEFTDAEYSPKYAHKLMAITCDHQLMVLKSRTLHVVHLETNAEKDLSLRSVRKEFYGVMCSSDGKLILLCKEGWEEKRHSVIKYDPELQQVVWVSDTLLLTDTPTDWDWVRKALRVDPLRDQLNVVGYLDYLYVLSSHRPTKMYKVNLSDGHIVQKIPCDGLFFEVQDICLRGNTLVTASCGQVTYFKIPDVTEII